MTSKSVDMSFHNYLQGNVRNAVSMRLKYGKIYISGLLIYNNLISIQIIFS